MIPDAVLSAFVEAKGCREATREVAKVQEQLREATKDANLATAAITRFGKMRGVAVLDVDAAKANAATAAAAKEVDGFSRTNGTATLDADAGKAHAATAAATSAIRQFGSLTAEARADLKIAGATAKISQIRALLADLGAQDQTIDVRVKAAKAVADLERVELSRSKLVAGLRAVDPPAQEASRAMASLGRGGRDGANGMNTLRGSVGPLSGGLGVVASSALLLGTALLAIIGPAAAVVAALGPLVGIAAGAGGALVAAAQGFGVFKLATMGVGDALKEQMKNSAAAGTQALSQAAQEVAAGRAIRAAQEAVADAQRNVREAIDALGPAYTEAQRRLRDMRDAVTSTSLSLREARFAASDARIALAQLLSGPSPRELADAHQAVADSVRGERDAVESLADAHRALNDLIAPPDLLNVADVHDAVRDAVRGETTAQIALARQLEATNAVLADPESTDLDKAEARARLADAENGVGDAARDTAKAQAALAKLEGGPAQAEIVAARRRVRDAEEAVAAAARETRDALAERARVETPASSDEIARARLALAQAEHGLALAMKDSVRAARDSGVAEAAGLARAPEVLAAREAIRAASVAATRAERSLSEAQHDAAASAGLAAGASAALNEKMSKLPEPAQAFVRQLQSMKPRLDALRESAAGGFFPGATAGLQAAMGSFSSVNKVVGETSRVLGEAARKSGELVGSPAFGKDIETIGGNNARVIGTLAEALRHVISAFRHVLVAAGPLTQWLADVANKWALNAAEAAKAGRETGKLAAFFERTREVAQRLGSIISSLASGFLGIGKAGTQTGNDILLSIDRAAKRFDEWANSVRGRNEIREFFEKTREIAAALLPALANLTAGFTLLALHLLPVVAALRLLGPLADEAVVAFVAYKLALTGARIATTAWGVAAGIAAFATGGWTTAFWALNAALVANPIGIVVVAIAALVAGLVIAYRESETFRAIIDTAFKGVVTAFGALLRAAQTVFGWLRASWPLLSMILVAPVRTAVTTIGGLWDAMRSAAITAWNAIRSAASTAWGLIRDAILAPVRFARDQLDIVVTGIGNRMDAGWEAIKSGAATAWNAIRDVILTPIRAARDLIGGENGIWAQMKNHAEAGWGALVKGVAGFAGEVKDKIEAAFRGAANLVIKFVRAIIGAINLIPGLPNIKPPELLADKDARGGTFARSGSMPGATEAFAHGGAFARTGGFVNAPITLMGEEAPRHPEFVIPTNPAYRGRAQMLLGQAAGAIGLAEGGVVSAFKGAIKDTGASQKPSLALWMAGIVESGLRNLTHGHADSLGALQLRESLHGRALAMDPYRSALAFLTRGFTGAGGAISLSKSDRTAGQVAQAVQGSAFPDRYDQVREQAAQYLGGGGGGGGIGAALTGAIGALFANGPGAILGKLPGVGDLPDWLKGTGKYVLDKAGDWIKDKVSGLVGGGGDLPDGISGDIKEAIAFSRTIGNWTFGPGQLFRPGGKTYHGQGRAADFGDAGHSATEMRELYRAFKGRYGSNIKELFYDPMGEHVQNGRVITSPFGGHGDHVHLALAQGGVYGPYGVLGSFKNGTDYVPQTGPYELHKGEKVTPAGAGNDRLIASNDRLSAALERLMATRHLDAVDALADHMGQRLGDGAVRRRQTAGDPNRTAIVS